MIFKENNWFFFSHDDWSGCGFLLRKGTCLYCWSLCKHRAVGCDPSSCNSPGAGFVALKQSAKTDITILALMELQLDELWGMCPDWMFSIRVKAQGVLTMIPLWDCYGNALMILYELGVLCANTHPSPFLWRPVTGLKMWPWRVTKRGRMRRERESERLYALLLHPKVMNLIFPASVISAIYSKIRIEQI